MTDTNIEKEFTTVKILKSTLFDIKKVNADEVRDKQANIHLYETIDSVFKEKLSQKGGQK